jgi:hypothetical protein
MHIDDIKEGLDYKIRAATVKSTDRFTVLSKRQNRHGGWEVEVRQSGNKATSIRTFTPESFRELDQKQSKKIVSNSVKLCATLSDGSEIWEEELINFPYQGRRGRKPKVDA